MIVVIISYTRFADCESNGVVPEHNTSSHVYINMHYAMGYVRGMYRDNRWQVTSVKFYKVNEETCKELDKTAFPQPESQLQMCHCDNCD